MPRLTMLRTRRVGVGKGAFQTYDAGRTYGVPQDLADIWLSEDPPAAWPDGETPPEGAVDQGNARDRRGYTKPPMPEEPNARARRGPLSMAAPPERISDAIDNLAKDADELRIVDADADPTTTDEEE